MKEQGVKKQPNAKEKQSSTKKKTKAIFAGCCAAALVVAGIGAVLWHPWDAGGNGEVGDRTQVGVNDTPAGTDAVGTVSGDVAQGDGWVLNMFRNLAPMVGSGQYEAWTEVAQDGAWDFKVEQPAGGEVACFTFSEEYAAMAERTETPLTVSALVEATNAKVEGGEAPFALSAGAGDYTLCDAGGQPVAYDANDALRALAQSAHAYRASWEGAQDEKTLEEYAEEYAQKLDNMDMTFIRGQRADKGKAEVNFMADTSDERIMEIIEEVGCEWVEGGLMDLRPAVEPYKYAVVATAVGCEEAAMDAFEEYPEVTSAEPTGGFMFDEAETNSSVAALSGQSSRSIDSWLQYYLRYSGFTDAWDTVKCNGSVTIGIIDSGIDWENTEILANVDTTHMANACTNSVVAGTFANMTDDDMANWFTTVNGTSFAAPQVAAAAALIKAAHPGYSAEDVKNALKDTTGTVVEVDSTQLRSGYGAGSLDADAAVMWSNMEGSGSGGSGSGSGSGGAGGNWSPTAGGSLLDTYREAKEQQAA